MVLAVNKEGEGEDVDLHRDLASVAVRRSLYNCNFRRKLVSGLGSRFIQRVKYSVSIILFLTVIYFFIHNRQLGPISEFMINSYCDSLKDTFAQLVYYGILKEEDAQCFSVQSSIEGGSFALAAGAVLLALINTFVVKAVVQYFRDEDELEKECLGDEEKCSNSMDSWNTELDESESIVSERIHPVPVLFTDTFRWLLRREGNSISSSRGIIPGIYESSFVLQQASAAPYDEGIIKVQSITAESNDGCGKGRDEKEKSEFVGTPVDCYDEDLGEEIVLEDIHVEGETAVNDEKCKYGEQQ
jgi:hypothetical protein